LLNLVPEATELFLAWAGLQREASTLVAVGLVAAVLGLAASAPVEWALAAAEASLPEVVAAPLRAGPGPVVA
jgi:hypothetical protein